MAEQIEAKHVKKGNYIMVEGNPSIANSNDISRPGKHGHAKCRITATGLIDNKKRVLIAPGELKIDTINIDKRSGQIVSIGDKIIQLMDIATYEMVDTIKAEDFKGDLSEGTNVEYWVMNDKKVIKANAKEK
ncbi:MAG: translation initiation factor IF-5A [Candidatus Nanohalarchaeota archaeon]|nr:MAG: translation initiation factor IF-5A [Candidatus Nanohaloarchaeota archaeon]